jgi:hypothetical protein
MPGLSGFFFKEVKVTDNVLSFFPEEALAGYECDFMKSCELKKNLVKNYACEVLEEFEELTLEECKNLWDGLSLAMKRAVCFEFLQDAFVGSYVLEGATEQWLVDSDAGLYEDDEQAYAYFTARS